MNEQLSIIDQFITDQYQKLTDREISLRLGLTEQQVKFRRRALVLTKSKSWRPEKPVITEARPERRYEPIGPEISIDEQIYALEMFAQDRPAGSVLEMIARNTIEHLQKIKQV